MFDMFKQCLPEPLHTVENAVFKNYLYHIFEIDEESRLKWYLEHKEGILEHVNRSFGDFVHERYEQLNAINKKIQDPQCEIEPEIKEKFMFLIGAINSYRVLVWGAWLQPEQRKAKWMELKEKLDKMCLDMDSYAGLVWEAKKKSNPNRKSSKPRTILPHAKNHLEEALELTNGCLYILHCGLFEHFHRILKELVPTQGGGKNIVLTVIQKWFLKEIGEKYIEDVEKPNLANFSSHQMEIEGDNIKVKVEKEEDM